MAFSHALQRLFQNQIHFLEVYTKCYLMTPLNSNISGKEQHMISIYILHALKQGMYITQFIQPQHFNINYYRYLCKVLSKSFSQICTQLYSVNNEQVCKITCTTTILINFCLQIVYLEYVVLSFSEIQNSQHKCKNISVNVWLYHFYTQGWEVYCNQDNLSWDTVILRDIFYLLILQSSTNAKSPLQCLAAPGYNENTRCAGHTFHFGEWLSRAKFYNIIHNSLILYGLSLTTMKLVRLHW